MSGNSESSDSRYKIFVLIDAFAVVSNVMTIIYHIDRDAKLRDAIARHLSSFGRC
jgi:hypothetical protein